MIFILIIQIFHFIINQLSFNYESFLLLNATKIKKMIYLIINYLYRICLFLALMNFMLIFKQTYLFHLNTYFMIYHSLYLNLINRFLSTKMTIQYFFTLLYQYVFLPLYLLKFMISSLFIIIHFFINFLFFKPPPKFIINYIFIYLYNIFSY